ncbi:MAG TPA: thioesterase family protein [Bacteroidales bacterium]|nr:thioesterase family protein [Bacteroidales bacterium]HOR82618.1 thioesterase family protein [Bacteroidales bacterium]HPJ91775.1 thioesterase family protein [Bacteroidales bacterium]HQB19423.1 thioesterase family protein [Bacteroidales bacterium]
MDTTSYTFHHQVPIQVRMTDIDPVGHVNNSVQLTYYDLGRLKYLETIQKKEIDWQELDMVVVHTACDFYNSIFLNDNIVVETKVVGIGEKSVKILQRIIDNTTNEIKSTCYSIMSGYDKKNNCSKKIPEYFKTKVLEFEK